MFKSEFEVLGEQVLRDVGCVGDSGFGSASGFNADFLINAASELTKRGVSTYEAGQQSDKDKTAMAQQVAKSISADANWANAEALLAIANQSHDASRVAPAQVLQQSAMASAQQAGAGLTGDAQAQRVHAAQQAADQAAQQAMSAPSDALKQAKMNAWQKVLSAAQTGGGAGAAGGFGGALGKHGGGSGNFLTKVHAGLPTYGWIGIVVGVLGGGALVVKALRK